MIKFARKALMALFTLAALADGGQTFADVRDGNAKLPIEYMPAAQVIFPECPTEDSEWCLWDAPSTGNKQGTPFVDVAGYVIIFD